MAGLGKKDFTAFSVLSAADVDGYLMDQSVMRFADSTARGTALGTALVAEGMVSYLDDTNAIEVYDGSNWVGLETTLQDGTAGYTALSNGTAGISYQPVSHNYIINGAFDIWQRGTAFTASAYTADRWVAVTAGGAYTGSYTQQSFSAGDLVVPGYGQPDYYFRASMTDPASLTTWSIRQRIEDNATLSGQTVTVSLWAKADTTRNIDIILANDGGTVTQGQTLTTSWARYQVTMTVPAATAVGTGFLDLRIGLNRVAGATYDLWGVQLEAGSVATPFKRHAPSLQGELAACQRYYYQINAETANTRFGNGHNLTTTAATILTPFPVTMRTRPTGLAQTGTAADYAVQHQNTATACSAIPVFVTANTNLAITNLTVASGLTTGQGSNGRFQDAGAYLGWSAEL